MNKNKIKWLRSFPVILIISGCATMPESLHLGSSMGALSGAASTYVAVVLPPKNSINSAHIGAYHFHGAL